MPQLETIKQIADECRTKIDKSGLGDIYRRRLDFEISEIGKQGADSYWVNLVRDDAKFDDNPNKLVLPWLLGMVESDPIASRTDPIITTTKYTSVLDFIATNGRLPPEVVRDADNPDIDIDCLPEARDPIKEYAVKKYGGDIDDGYGAVCSVGTWQTYLFKSAITDVAKATGACSEAETKALTKELPEDVDDVKDNGESPCKSCQFVHRDVVCPKCGSNDTDNPTIGQILAEYDVLKAFYDKYPGVIEYAIRLIGRIRSLGKHAGALIIADRPLFGNIPMALDMNTKQWKSLWSEGRSTQLSKYGYTKWDILGLKNLRYIYEASRMIEQNHGISFGKRINAEYKFDAGHKVVAPSMSGWDDIDPETRCAGHYYTRDGEEVTIDMDDAAVLLMASEARTDAVFQFDTDLAKRILTDSNGVRSFFDLMIFNAMGHPGPMAMIPDYVERRDDLDGTWRNLDDPRITEILGETYNTIVYQEQLQALWQNIAGFTAPEAQEARKAVAKKWRDKLKPIREKWLRGAGPVLGDQAAMAWWDKMETFGRYAFNRSHSVAYCLVAFRCLWLKSYFPHEWWASVMSYCDPKKLVRYMNVARGEGVVFMPMDINNLTMNFVAVPESPRVIHSEAPNGCVLPGLICLKGVGDKLAAKFITDKSVLPVKQVDDDEDGREEAEQSPDDAALIEEIEDLNDVKVVATGPIASVDDFVDRNGKSKTMLERLIKLGAFRNLPGHANTKALWEYYTCKYCSGADVTKKKKEYLQRLLALDGWDEIKIATERQRQIDEFKQLYPKRTKIPPKITNWVPKVELTLENIGRLFADDYDLSDVLKFEETYLGYNIHSPLDLFVTKGSRSVEDAKESGELEAVITDVFHAVTKNGSPMCRLTVTDGLRTATLILWSDDLESMDKAILRRGTGFRSRVSWDINRRNFTLCQGCQIIRLKRKD